MKKSDMIKMLDSFLFEIFIKRDIDTVNTYFLAEDIIDFLENNGMSPPFNLKHYQNSWRKENSSLSSCIWEPENETN